MTELSKPEWVRLREKSAITLAHERLTKLREEINRAKSVVILAHLQSACDHLNLETSPVYGDKCLDCGFDFHNPGPSLTEFLQQAYGRECN